MAAAESAVLLRACTVAASSPDRLHTAAKAKNVDRIKVTASFDKYFLGMEISP
jgi:hypothetical protein